MRRDKLWEVLVILALCFAIGAYVVAIAAFVKLRLDGERASAPCSSPSTFILPPS